MKGSLQKKFTCWCNIITRFNAPSFIIITKFLLRSNKKSWITSADFNSVPLNKGHISINLYKEVSKTRSLLTDIFILKEKNRAHPCKIHTTSHRYYNLSIDIFASGTWSSLSYFYIVKHLCQHLESIQHWVSRLDRKMFWIEVNWIYQVQRSNIAFKKHLIRLLFLNEIWCFDLFFN